MKGEVCRINFFLQAVAALAGGSAAALALARTIWKENMQFHFELKSMEICSRSTAAAETEVQRIFGTELKAWGVFFSIL